ncbi:MAG: metalloregulator ArsR/SmtB family transcription factor [Bacteroidetes bacterium]|nr:metalloregulator ArsR/SmtB family transcription factor [Bacteroidota bacterium]
MRRDVFQAIADPTRREIIYLLTDNKLTLNKVAENFNISRPAVSKHIKILNECGLVTISQFGRERYCKINAEPLKEVYNWLEYFNKFWDKKLNSLKNYVEGK